MFLLFESPHHVRSNRLDDAHTANASARGSAPKGQSQQTKFTAYAHPPTQSAGLYGAQGV